MKRRFRKFVLLFVLATAPLALAADRQRVKEVGQKFVCVCGTCNQLLTECNHFGCPSSGPMLAEIAAELDEGQNDQSIVAHFAEKYGLTVLSSPPASGFNLAAWVMPFAALAIGAVGAIHFLHRFWARWAGTASTHIDLTRYRDKIEAELKRFIPE